MTIDWRAYLGRWLCDHGLYRLGSYLYTNSRTWRDYVRAQAADIDDDLTDGEQR